MDPLVDLGPELTTDELRRYSRHLLIPDIGVAGQRRLKNARVLVVGAGGLGSPALLYLAAAGVGTLGIVDFDVVDETNLQRQVLHATADIARPKVDSAAEHLAALNPTIQIIRHTEALTAANAEAIIAGYDLVLDGADNFATRYLVNDACAFAGKPYAWASIFRFDGQVTVFWAGHGPCYRCVYPEPPPPGAVPNCAEAGVLGVLPGVLGSVQAAEAIKLITGAGRPLLGRLVLHDALQQTWRELAIERDPDCPVCGDRPSITELVDYDDFCGTPPLAATDDGLTPADLTDLLAQREAGETSFTLIDVREPVEAEIARIDGSVLIPKGRIDDGATKLPEGKLILYCASGKRSGQVRDLLAGAGRADVQHLSGGIDAWSAYAIRAGK